MDAFKKLLRLPYKVYLMMRERFFLIPPPGNHPPQPSSFMGEGMGGDEFQQNVELVQKQPPCFSLEEEIKLVEKKTEDIEIPPPGNHPPQPSSFMGEGMGGDEFQPSPFSTSGGGDVLEEERTVAVHPSPLTPPTRGRGKTVPPPVPLTEGEKGGWGRPSGGAELLQRTSDFEMSPLLEDQRISLCETLDRVLNTGVVVHGDITISVANIDLIYIGLRALLTSVETARQAGINHK